MSLARDDDDDDDGDGGPLATLLALHDDLTKGELPIVFDVEHDGMEQCAFVFCKDNGIPPERLNRDVFETLVGLRTVRDLTESPLFQRSAKMSATNSLRNAFAATSVRTFHTQGILRPLVHPTAQEMASSYARLDVSVSAFPFKTMGEHPFFSECVSNKFLQFWISPGGDLRFLCDLSDPVAENEQRELAQLKLRLGNAVTRQENATRDRLRRKLEAKAAKHTRAEQQREKPTAPAASEDAVLRFFSDGADLSTAEEKEKLRLRKERAAAERVRREAAARETETAVAPASPTRPTAKARKKKVNRPSSAAAMAKKTVSIDLAMLHTETLAERERNRVAEAEALLEVRRIGYAIQRGD